MKHLRRLGTVLCLLSALTAPPARAAVLSFVEVQMEGYVFGLAGATAVVVSPDGLHVYVAGHDDDAVVPFGRNPSTGALSDLDEAVSGYCYGEGESFLCRPRALAISPDGLQLYVASDGDSSLTVFSRDPGTGSLSSVESLVDDIDGVDGLAGARGVAISPDGKHVYVVGFEDLGKLAVFSRNAVTGALTFVSATPAGLSCSGCLDSLMDVTVSPDGAHVYTAAGSGGGVAAFGRNPTTGALTFIEAEQDGVGGVDSLSHPDSVRVSPDGTRVFVTSGDGDADNALTVFARDAATGMLTGVSQVFENDGGVTGLFLAAAVAVSPDGRMVLVAGEGDDALAVFGPSLGSLAFKEAHVNGMGGVSGLGGASGLAVSPDGRHVYVTGKSSNAVAVFSANDDDGDDIRDYQDNCPRIYNPEQFDVDQGGVGDACDPCPNDPANLCNFLIGGGPDPTNPAQSILYGINPDTGGAIFPGALARTAASGGAPLALVASGAFVELMVVPYPNLSALTCDRRGNLYAGTADGLMLKLDAATGTSQVIGSAFPFQAVAGLATAFDGTIFATVTSGVSWCGSLFSADFLSVFDPGIGQMNPVGFFLGPPITDMEGLDLDPLNGTLYGVSGVGDCSTGNKPALYTIDAVSGLATRIALVQDASNAPPPASPAGLAFDRRGTLYASLGGNVGDILRIDPVTGVFTRVGATGSQAAIEALTFCPVLDRFLSYKGKALGVPLVLPAANLDDPFGQASAPLKKPGTAATPAEAQDADIENRGVTLTGYKTAGGAFTPDPFAQRTGLLVQNSLPPGAGRITIDVVKLARLLVPTSSSGDDHLVDHFACYKVKISKGQPKFPKGVFQQVGDALANTQPQPTKLLELKKPLFLCAQADINGRGIRNPGVHLMCYQVKPAKGEPKFLPQGLLVADEFVPGAMMTLTKEEALCVPSLIGNGGG